MKKFMFLYVGSQDPTQDVMDGWTKWFSTFGDKVVDGGNPFGAGKEFSKSGVKDLALGPDAISGYTIINAADMDEALAILNTCPVLTSVRVYECIPM